MTVQASAVSSRAGTAREPRILAIRAEIQALRALAVGVVVIYHLWPDLVPGGFVGVDVFFAISGYLIIGHLLRSFDATGNFPLWEFWARRARRLIPAALVVLTLSCVTTLVVAPSVLWERFVTEIAAAAVYVENWLLAGASVDYLASDDSASPAQHYWSLSIEEQFYIVWPLMLVAVLITTRRLRHSLRRRFIGVALASLSAASLWYSIVQVASGTPIAYFDTFGRAWEFGAGGLLAYFSGVMTQVSPRARAVASWTGISVVVATVFAYGSATPFPGAAALLPVLGALLIMLAGTPNIAWSPTRVLAMRSLRWTGDRSYSVYLWHWPIIVLLPFIVGSPSGNAARVGILVATLVLAALTYRYIEEPVRRGRLFRAWHAPATVVAAITASGMVLALCGSVIAVASVLPSAGTAQRPAIPGCVGAEAAVAPACDRPFAATTLTDPVAASVDYGRGVASDDPCKALFESIDVVTCTFGAQGPDARQRIAVIGDSHAAHLIEALDVAGQARGVSYVTYLKTLCVGIGVDGVAAADKAIDYGVDSCAAWGESVIDTVVADERIDAVIFANFTRQYAVASTNGVGRPIATGDFESAWNRIESSGKQVAVIRDVPQATLKDVPSCIASADTSIDDPCAFARSAGVLDDDPMVRAAVGANVGVVDLTDVFCDETSCHSLIGGLIVYIDSHHLTAAFSKSLGTVLGERIESALKQAN